MDGGGRRGCGEGRGGERDVKGACKQQLLTSVSCHTLDDPTQEMFSQRPVVYPHSMSYTAAMYQYSQRPAQCLCTRRRSRHTLTASSMPCLSELLCGYTYRPCTMSLHRTQVVAHSHSLQHAVQHDHSCVPAGESPVHEAGRRHEQGCGVEVPCPLTHSLGERRRRGGGEEGGREGGGGEEGRRGRGDKSSFT